MGSPKKKAVINVEAEQLARVEDIVRAGRYRSVSELMREAIDDKLRALAETRVAEQVERYCANPPDDDDDLIAAQAFDDAPRGRRKKGPSASR